MDTLAIALFRKRREERLAARGIRIKKKQYRKTKDLKKLEKQKPVPAFHKDADGDDDQQNEQQTRRGGGGHGNTKLPFGLCKKYGIEIEDSWTPRDAWDALAGKGITPGEIYKKLRAGEELGPDMPDPPKKDPVKTIDGGDGKYYLTGLYASRGWASRGVAPYVLRGHAEWYDSVPEEERHGYRSEWLGRFYTTTDMYLFLKKKGVEEFMDPETGEIVNPAEMELPHVAYTDGERGFSALTLGMKGERYAITGTDFDGKKKAIQDFGTLERCKEWMASRGISEDDVKMSPALKKREAERVSWMTSDKKAYVESDGVKYGDLHILPGGRYTSDIMLVGESESGRPFKMLFSTESDLMRYLKDEGVEDVRGRDKKHVNPQEVDLPEAVARIGGRYYTKFHFGMEYGRLTLFGEDLDGKQRSLSSSYGYETSRSFMDRALQETGVEEGLTSISDEAKEYIEQKKAEEEFRDRIIKEFPEKAIEIGGSKWMELHLEKTGDDRYVLRGYDKLGRERAITSISSLGGQIDFAASHGIDLGEIIKDKEQKAEYDKAMERRQHFEEMAEQFGAYKYVDIELKEEGGYYRLYGYDKAGTKRSLTSGGDFIDVASEAKKRKGEDVDIDRYIKDPEVKKQYEAHKKRMAEFESKAIEIDGAKAADVTVERYSYNPKDFIITGYDAKGRKFTPIYGSFDMHDTVRELEKRGLRVEDHIKDPDIKKAYEEYQDHRAKFEAEAIDFGTGRYRDIRTVYEPSSYGRGMYSLMGKDIKGKDKIIARGYTAKEFEDDIKSTSGRDDYTIDTFTATPEMEERKKYLKKAKEAIASGEYKDMGVDGSAFKDIHADKIGDKWSIKGVDIDGQEKQIVETADWDDTVDMLERFGVTDYKLLTRDKTYSRPTDGMRHVILMRGTDGNFKVYADSASKGTHAEMYSTPSEEEARRWLEENNVSTAGLKTRGMNPNDDVPRTHTQSSLANFDSYRMKKFENSFIEERMTDEEKKEAADMLTEVFAVGSYRVARSTKSFGGIIENGYKSQVETGKGGYGAAHDRDLRKEASKKFYGHSGLDNKEYEKCGYIGLSDEAEDWDDSGHPFYGGGSPMTYTLRKDTMKDRTTYTYGDSLNTRRWLTSAGYAGDKPTIEGITSLDGPGEVRRALEYWRKYKNGDIDYKTMFEGIRREADNRYIELQFHGPVTVKDIEKISFKRESDLKDAFEGMKPERRKRVVKLLQENNVGILYRKDRYSDFVDGWDWVRQNYPDAFVYEA